MLLFVLHTYVCVCVYQQKKWGYPKMVLIDGRCVDESNKIAKIQCLTFDGMKPTYWIMFKSGISLDLSKILPKSSSSV